LPRPKCARDNRADRKLAKFCLHGVEPAVSTLCSQSGKHAEVESEDAWRANMSDLILDDARFENLFGETPSYQNVPDDSALDSLSTDQSKFSYSVDLRGSHVVVINTDPVGKDAHAPTVSRHLLLSIETMHGPRQRCTRTARSRSGRTVSAINTGPHAKVEHSTFASDRPLEMQSHANYLMSTFQVVLDEGSPQSETSNVPHPARIGTVELLNLKPSLLTNSPLERQSARLNTSKEIP
jgi:hypothetical protein